MVTLFVFILIASWISRAAGTVRHGGGTHELLQPPASGVNPVLARAVRVPLLPPASGASGLLRPPAQDAPGARGRPGPINIVRRTKLISLSSDFGSIFAGGIIRWP